MNLKTLIGATLVAGVAFAAGTASATVYRAGLAGGYINSYDSGKYQSVDIPDIGIFDGPEAGKIKGGNTNVKTYPPVWADNRTWGYHGQMYFDGGSYWFIEAIDDAVFISVDGSQKLKDGTWNNNGVSSEVKPEAGWHDIVFRFGNGTGGAGVYSDDSQSNRDKAFDKYGNLCGIGISRDPANHEKMWSCVYPDKSFFRVAIADSFLSRSKPSQTATGYELKISSSAPQTVNVVVCYGAEAAGEDTTAWANVTEPVEVESGVEKTVAFDWNGEIAPYCAVKLYGADDTGDFYEWSEPMFLGLQPLLSAEIKSVSTAEASFDVAWEYNLAVGDEAPGIVVTACYGLTDGGDNLDAWDLVVPYDPAAPGSDMFTLTRLSADKTYHVVFAADAEGASRAWSRTFKIGTGAVSIFGPELVFENELVVQKFKVVRPLESAATDITVGLSVSGDAGRITAIPESVTIPVGVDSVDVQFSMVDNDEQDGDGEIVIALLPGTDYALAEGESSLAIKIVDDESAVGGDCIWTGLAGDDRWENSGNWKDGRVPNQLDTALIDDTGLDANVITLESSRHVRKLIIAATKALNIKPADGATDAQLTFAELERRDVEGNEGNFDLSVPFVIYPAEAGKSFWDVNGSSALRVYGRHTAAIAGTTLVKTGAANVELRYGETAFSGPWDVREGQVIASVKDSMCGDISIGGYGTKATVSQSPKNGFKGRTVPYVYTNGTFNGNNDIDNGRCEEFHVFKGGVVNISYYFYSIKAFMTGGTLNGGKMFNGGWNQTINAAECDEMATFNCEFGLSGYYDMTIPVADGASPVDLLITKNVSGGAVDHTTTKSGVGTLKSTAGFGLNTKVTVSGGRWFVDNATGSGTGSQAVSVTGGLLGGIGTIYGVNANVTASNSAKIAPGTIDTVTGVHSNGTFTVGNADNANSVTFNGNSVLEVAVGEGRVDGRKTTLCDKLNVFGAINVAGAGATLSVVLADPEQDVRNLKGGEFVIAEAAGGISGAFANVQMPEGAKWKVRYEENRIVLSIPNRGMSIYVQ